ncbi:hypothetical protein Pcinc_029888 [Petrolisthes cinctipes]|uniref:Uncharacterized protein n=1 Tax=Petrolisthes cinctipes TaxID=88211 RepID=A0AAE1F020_PETCI|nr:hypothetical protein Pcinc_036732 [Petrolisthes cinctipes]KAK3864431.1 hypothetical protein Pcinc_029888 [Petrolisthes cinctipes]
MSDKQATSVLASGIFRGREIQGIPGTRRRGQSRHNNTGKVKVEADGGDEEEDTGGGVGHQPSTLTHTASKFNNAEEESQTRDVSAR